MKYLSIILFSVFAFSNVIAQESLMKATVYLTDNQTVKGDVFLYDSEPDNIVLEKENGETSRIFNENIKYIENDGNILKSCQYNSGYQLFDVIVDGEKMSLLRTTKNQAEVFYIYKDGKVYLLEGGRKTIVKGSKTYNTDNLRYRGVLKVLIKSEPKLVKKTDNIKYKEKDLVDIVIAYNNGKITFLKTEEIVKKNKTPNLMIFLQYTNAATNAYFSYDNQTPSFFQAGVQYYFSKESRHSLKLGLEYGVYTQPDSEYDHFYNIVDLNISYYMDLYRMRHSAIYFNVRAADLTYITKTDDSHSNIIMLPRISPGFGFKYQINKFYLFAEINNMIQYKTVPYNFSFGITVDL